MMNQSQQPTAIQLKPGVIKKVQILGQPTTITPNPYNTSAGTVSGMQTKTVTAGVSANPHHFQPSLANQSTASHVTSSQSHDTNVPSVTASETEQQTAPQLANTKEKTPMCLINELARFNKITHQYALVDEQGPAHKKAFYVKLQLGDKEDYSASGPSIKKAQHAAAATALEKTECKHPPPKVVHKDPFPEQIHVDETGDAAYSSITPTVELNSLAMKRGEPAVYRNLENRNTQPMYCQQNYDFRGMYNQRYHYMRPPRIYYVSLKVGLREFIGEGNSRQMARHNAATKALGILSSLPMPDPTKLKATTEDVEAEKTDEEDDNATKSEISMVHELALKHNLPVSFDVTRESGPPHMKTFITVCTVGSYRTESEGNSKKLSKKRAADNMLKELQILPALPPSVARPKQKQGVNKKKGRNLIKQMQKAEPGYGVGINPISRLIQIQQAQKKKEPVYTLLAERGLPRRREFIMQVQVDEEMCTGVGPNKKLAKRHAAEAMLLQLGYNKPSPQPSKPAIKMPNENSPGDKKVTFVESSEESKAVVNGQGGRQNVPGLLVLPEGNRLLSNSYTNPQQTGSQSSFNKPVIGKVDFGMRAELKLREVAARHNIPVKFDEFSGKNNVNEYLSRVVVASNPQHTLHGSGQTPEASRDAAALTALKLLSEMGIVIDDPAKTSSDGSKMKGVMG